MTANGADYNRMAGEGEESTASKAAKGCCKVFGLGCFCFVVLILLLQSALFYWATMKCSAKKLEGYTYPGGGKDNLVPSNSLLIEQDPTWLSSSFIVQPADDVGLATGASTGVYFRTWGPMWWTYVYQDNLGMQTFYSRDRPLALGGSHKIFRCDRTGPIYIINEGNHVIMNSIRSFFGMYTSRVYNIWQDNKLVALSEKVGGAGQSHKQIIYRLPKEANPFASSFLSNRHYHGSFDEWFVHDEEGETELPAFVVQAGTALMAFPTAQAKRAKQKSDHAAEVPSAFAAMPAGFDETSPSAMEEATHVSLEDQATATAFSPTAQAERSEQKAADAEAAPSAMAMPAGLDDTPPSATENFQHV